MRQPDYVSPDGSITLYCADCLEILPEMAAGSVDAVFADFPYGINMSYDSYNDTQDNLSHLVSGVFPHLVSASKVVAITCGVVNQWVYPRPDWVMAWVTDGATASSWWGFQCWQPILLYGKDPYLSSGLGRRPDIIKYSSFEGKESNGHPCSKPVGFMRRVIERISTGGVVLDPFMGSGTTGVACVQTGRRFIGIEISPAYFEIAVKRIERALMQPRLL